MAYYQRNRENIILADCEEEELLEFVEGFEEAKTKPFSIKSKICNGGHGKFSNIKRYMIYAMYPLKFVFRHNKYEYIVGWQQFFALFFVFYCRLFHVKKTSTVIAVNFTYKEKSGWLGRIYKRFMKYCVDSEYLDFIHVPSLNYAQICARLFKVSIDKFIVVTFGLPDTYVKWKNSSVEYQNYSFAIGRSNRDFDFLVEAWKEIPATELLVIASDTFKPKSELPANVIHRIDIGGNEQFPYIANCKMMIIPIDDGTICSGDTVLLKAMSYEKPVVVTVPSTLGEMYIEDRVDGILVEKDTKKFAEIIRQYISDNIKLKQLATSARKSYEEKFSRKNMGKQLAHLIYGK